MNEDVLKPCPFCGSHDVRWDGPDMKWLACAECNCEGPTYHLSVGDDTPKGVIQLWNMRAIRDELLAEDTP